MSEQSTSRESLEKIAQAILRPELRIKNIIVIFEDEDDEVRLLVGKETSKPHFFWLLEAAKDGLKFIMQRERESKRPTIEAVAAMPASLKIVPP